MRAKVGRKKFSITAVSRCLLVAVALMSKSPMGQATDLLTIEKIKLSSPQELSMILLLLGLRHLAPLLRLRLRCGGEGSRRNGNAFGLSFPHRICSCKGGCD